MGDVRVAALDELVPGSATRVDVEGHRLCLVRIDDDVYVIGDRCSHADYSLAEGELWPEEREIECPKHGSTFSLLTGEALVLPATRPVPVYAVRTEDDAVIVTLPDPPGADDVASAEDAR